jgi:DNA-binding GntR family transcriptional regulator
MPYNVLEQITIDRRSRVPYEEQIKERIKAAILDQTLYYQTLLPSIDLLAASLEIKQSKVKKAYERLALEGFIRNDSKEGYKVSYFELTNYFFDRNTAVYDAIAALGLSPSIRCLKRELVSLNDDNIVRMGFNPKEGNQFFHIYRIYCGNEQPIMVLENYLPCHIFDHINDKFISTEPLNAFLKKSYGIQAQISKRVTKAVNLTPELAKLLNESPNSASIQSTNHIYDQRGRLIDYGRSHTVSSYYFQLLITKEDMKDGYPKIFNS